MKLPRTMPMPRAHRLGLIAAYGVFALMVVLTLWAVGNTIRLRYVPAGEVTLTVPYARYVLGDEVTFTLTNKYNSVVYLQNNCPQEPLAVYRFENNAWQRIHDEVSPATCGQQDRQVKLDPSSSVTLSYKRWNHLFASPGRYRIVAYVSYYHELPYADFDIVSAPTVTSIPELLSPSAPATGSSGTRRRPAAPAAESGEADEGPVSTGTSPTGPAPGTTSQSKAITTTAGTINITYTSTVITLVSVVPLSGWTYEKSGSGANLQITFQKPGKEVQVTLRLVGGKLQQTID